MSAAPKWLAAPPGLALSAAREGSPESIARQFLDSHSGLVGLTAGELTEVEVSGVVPAPDGGARVHFRQYRHGMELFGGAMLVTLAGDGSVRSLGGSLYGEIPEPARPIFAAVDAVRRAVHDPYPDLPFVGDRSRVEGEKTFFDEPAFGRPPQARLVLFPEGDGARTAWEVRIAERSFLTDYTVLIDAVSGEILYRRNNTLYARARILNAGLPDAQGEEFDARPYEMVTIPSVTPESPQGWLSGDGTSLEGNNAASHLDYDNQPGLSDPAAVYDYPFGTQESSLVNAWYWVNDAHDRFYAAGFDEAAGNFQQDNFGLGGVGGDRMDVVA
jgi:hypothetical protein